MPAKLNGKKVKRLRKEKHITQENLAERTNSSDRYIRDLENGRKRNPSASLLSRMSKALEVPMDELMESDLSAE